MEGNNSKDRADNMATSKETETQSGTGAEDILPVVLNTAKEVMRRGQAGMYSDEECAMQVVQLQRAAALGGKSRQQAVHTLRDQLERHLPERRHIVEGISARVVDIIESNGHNRSLMEVALIGLVEQVRDSVDEIAEHTATALTTCGLRHVVVIASTDGQSPVEQALVNAGEASVEKGSKLRVSVVRLHPDGTGIADKMASRLKTMEGIEATVVDDTDLTRILVGGGKVVIQGIALDIDEGVVCAAGSALLCSVANRMRIPVIVTISKFGMIPVGSSLVHGLTSMQRYPGSIWDYDDSRDDRRHEAVSIVAPGYDVLPLQKMDMVVTESGGIAPEYVVNLLPSFERNN